jgi:DNA-binding transcriptional MocR family regulator
MQVDITITNGSTHSVETVMALLLNAGDALLVEEFTWSHATESIFGPRMYDMLPVKLDRQGLDPEHLQQVTSTLVGACMPHA